MLGLALAVLGLSAGVCAVLTCAVRGVGRRAGLLDSVGVAGHEKRLRGVPNVGGVALFWTVAGLLGLGLWGGVSGGSWFAGLVPSVARGEVAAIGAAAPAWWGVLGGALVLHLLGVVDDRRALGAWVKLAVMAVPCVALPALFEEARLLTVLGPVTSVLLTACWLVVVTNAMNFMDNSDGLSATVGCVVCVVMLVHGAATGQWGVAVVSGVVGGGCLGFLVFNAPPASIFLGDGGALVLGYLLGVLTVMADYAVLPGSGGAVGGAAAWLGALAGLLMPVAVLAVPLYDSVVVVLLRALDGRPLVVGDQKHLSHRLKRRGLGDGGVVVVIGGLSVACGVSGLALANGPAWMVPMVGIQLVVCVAVLGVLESGTGGRPGDADAGVSG